MPSRLWGPWPGLWDSSQPSSGAGGRAAGAARAVPCARSLHPGRVLGEAQSRSGRDGGLQGIPLGLEQRGPAWSCSLLLGWGLRARAGWGFHGHQPGRGPGLAWVRPGLSAGVQAPGHAGRSGPSLATWRAGSCGLETDTASPEPCSPAPLGCLGRAGAQGKDGHGLGKDSALSGAKFSPTPRQTGLTPGCAETVTRFTELGFFFP